LRPTQLLVALKLVFNDVEMTTTSTTFQAAYMSVLAPYFKPF
jgi:hypothetical protein